MDTINNAIQLMDEGNVKEALSTLQKHLKTATDDEKFMTAEIYYEWGYFEEASSLLEKLLIKYPNEGQLIVQLTGMYIELEEDERAIQLLNDVDEDDEFYLESLLHLADLYQAQGLFEVSEQKLLEAKKISPDEIVIDFALGEFLFSIGQANRAIPFYEKVVKETEELNGISINERLAESHASIGHYEVALVYFEKADSDNPDTLFKYGFTANQHHRHDIAIRTWKKLLEIDPYYHTVYYELADAMKNEGLLNEAFDIAKKGLSYDEFNKELFFIAGQLAIQLLQEKEGFQYLNKAIALDQDYKEAIMLLVELYKQKGHDEAIIELITTVQNAGSSDPIYDWELAKAYVEQEMFKDAFASYEEASIHLIHDSDFLKEYGYFLSEEGLFKKATNIFSKYLKLEPSDTEIQAFVERLNDSNL